MKKGQKLYHLMINKDIVYSTLLQIWSHFISFVCSGNVSRNGKTSECSSTIFIAVLMAGITNLNWAYTLMYFPLNEPTLRYWKLSLSLSHLNYALENIRSCCYDMILLLAEFKWADNNSTIIHRNGLCS